MRQNNLQYCIKFGLKYTKQNEDKDGQHRPWCCPKSAILQHATAPARHSNSKASKTRITVATARGGANVSSNKIARIKLIEFAPRTKTKQRKICHARENKMLSNRQQLILKSNIMTILYNATKCRIW